jgi:hypothetical protein
MKIKIFKKCACIAAVCYALVAFVRCASEAPEVSSVEQSNRVELESFFAKLQANDFSVLNELIPTTFSLDEAKAKAKEVIHSSAENLPVVDKAALLRGHKYLEKYVGIGADGRFELGDEVDYQKIISDATLTVEERKTEIATLYIVEFIKQVPDNTNTAKIKKTGSSQKISPKEAGCTFEWYIELLGNTFNMTEIFSAAIVGEILQEMIHIVYDLYPETTDLDLIDTIVVESLYAYPEPLCSIAIILYTGCFAPNAAVMVELLKTLC